MTGAIGLLTLPYIIFVLWISAKFALALKYKRPYRLILFAFLTLMVVSILAQFLWLIIEELPVILAIGAQFVLGLLLPMFAVWASNLLINGDTPKIGSKQILVKSKMKVTHLPNWAFGRILAVATLPIAFLAIFILTKTPNLGMGIMIFSILYLLGLTAAFAAFGLALDNYWSSSTLTISALGVASTWALLVISLYVYIKEVYWQSMPIWLVCIFILAALCLAGIYARDHNRLNIYSR